MSWTASVIDETLTGNGYEKAVALSDGVSTKFVQRYQTDGTLANLRLQVLATIAAKDKQVGKNETPPGTVINTTPDVPAVPTPPTQAEKDAQTFESNIRDLAAIRNASNFGLTTTIDGAAAKASAQKLLDTYGAALTGVLANG